MAINPNWSEGEREIIVALANLTARVTRIETRLSRAMLHWGLTPSGDVAQVQSSPESDPRQTTFPFMKEPS